MVSAAEAQKGSGARRSVTALVVLLVLAVLLNYVDRGAIGVAAPLMKTDLGLSATQFGIAVSGFFWIYGLAQPFTGWLADRISVYRIFALGVAVWAVSTVLTGFVGGLTGLIVLRVLLGAGESFVFPCSSKMIAIHVPPERRGVANGAMSVGIALGPALGTLAGGAILAQLGWRAVFVIFGAATLLWLIPWQMTLRTLAKPETAQAGPPLMSYRKLLSHKALWLLSLCHITANYGYFFTAIWLPLYLTSARGFSIPTMTAFATATFATMALSSVIAGQLSDHLTRGGRDEGEVRRMVIVVGQIVVTIGVLGVAYAASPGAVLGWLLLTGFGLGLGTSMVFALSQIFAGPRLAGSWVGVQNAMGSLSGIVGPIVTGMIVDATGSFVGAFVFTAVVTGIGALLYLFVLPPIRQIEGA
ncbi:MFS transporter [Novosphingobium sp. Chol11]|uniref:MFS transporter n=1 Tax=Novosphingobium sp. Chol11 TaxID=1385763 RepID=UPI0025CDB5CF|nr:MFS transporter [Novosphingobium sp. Chol11]